MKYVFGPVPSRRLGQSLGIDPLPLKTCNWNCVYCQLGRSLPLTNQRREYFPRKEIITEVERALKAHTAGHIDWITFVGAGEPTLHASIGLLIRQIKTLTDLPVAVITNGALLYLPEVRAELMAADAVLPTLDAGTPELYRKINRPHPDITFERLVDGLQAFRREFKGKYWLEVMLLDGYTSLPPQIHQLTDWTRRIRPDKVQLNTAVRPPAEEFAVPVGRPPRERRVGAWTPGWEAGRLTIAVSSSHW